MEMNLIQTIEKVTKLNAVNAEMSTDFQIERHNILIQEKSNYLQERDELATQYDLVEIDALSFVFYRIARFEGGICKINNGPGTPTISTVQESELSAYLDIERPVISYHPGEGYNCDINRYLRNLIKKENALIVIDRIDKIESDVNRRVLQDFIRLNKLLSPVPVIAITSDNADNRMLYSIRTLDGKDRFHPYPLSK